MGLRPYQESAREQLSAGFRAGLRTQCLVSPTGSGKTTIAADMIRRAVERGKRVLFLVHRKELAEQASQRLDDSEIGHGIIMADHWRNRPAERVQVCSIPTLARREHRPEADLLIVDESHHASSDSYAKLLASYPKAWVVGLTATPWRQDGKGLADIFQRSVVAATPSELIEQGSLCNYAGFRFEPPDLSSVETRGGEYEEQGLSVACSKAVVIGDVVGQWLAHAKNQRTVVFGVNLAHAQMLADAFRAEGVAAETIDYLMGRDERDGVVARVKSGETRVVCNVGILGEGVDIPALECVVLARPTKSLALYLQQVGRVMRPCAGKLVARIHDHGGMVDRFGLPDDERDYSLQASRESNGKARPKPLTTCKSCFAIFERTGDTCPVCGANLGAQGKPRAPVESVDGQAVDIRERGPSRKERDAWLKEMVAKAIRYGFKPGWILYQHDKEFPGAPKPYGAFRAIKAARTND